jgi:hypothetical protein
MTTSVDAVVGSTPCPRCSKLVPGKIAVGGMSYLPPRWETCPKCNGRGVLKAMPPALLPEERSTGKLRYPLASNVKDEGRGIPRPPPSDCSMGGDA